MIHRVILPKLELTMEEASISQWFKSEGDKVKKGDVLFEIETDKAVVQVEAQADGVLRRILVKSGKVVPVNTVVAIIADPEDRLDDIETTAKKEELKPQEPPSHAQILWKQEEASKAEIKASPAARRRARELGIDIFKVQGTGPGGRITEKDVEIYFRSKTKDVAEGKELEIDIVPLSAIRKAIADKVLRAATTIPHIHIVMEMDASEMVKLHNKLVENPRLSNKPTYSDFLVKLVAKVLEDFPMLNSSYDDGQIKIFKHINIGLAVNTKDGLFVPVIRNANRKTIFEIHALSRELIKKANERKLSLEELSGGTFTISNLGMYQVDFFDPIINIPQCGILGVGRITERVCVVNGSLVIRPTFWANLAVDHRIVDGALAAQFLEKLKSYIESPDLERMLI